MCLFEQSRAHPSPDLVTKPPTHPPSPHLHPHPSLLDLAPIVAVHPHTLAALYQNLLRRFHSSSLCVLGDYHLSHPQRLLLRCSHPVTLLAGFALRSPGSQLSGDPQQSCLPRLKKRQQFDQPNLTQRSRSSSDSSQTISMHIHDKCKKKTDSKH